MRYVMVPVPREFVLDIMRLVLFRTSEGDEHEVMRDEARLRSLLQDADDLTRALVAHVARCSLDDSPLLLADAAAEVGVDADNVRQALKTLNSRALGPGRELIRTSNEVSVGPLGKRGKAAYLTMRREHARSVRALTASPPTPG